MKRIWIMAVLPGVLAFSCGRVSDDEAVGLVRHYNETVSEAYRRGDIELIDSVVATNSVDGTNLTGLIGVRRDLGITLDATLLTLKLLSVDQPEDQLRITTAETWKYKDRKVGTGEQVAEASNDSYKMLYIFRKDKGRWMVEETRFVEPPKVGRKKGPWDQSTRVPHGMKTQEEGTVQQ